MCGRIGPLLRMYLLIGNNSVVAFSSLFFTFAACFGNQGDLGSQYKNNLMSRSLLKSFISMRSISIHHVFYGDVAMVMLTRCSIVVVFTFAACFGNQGDLGSQYKNNLMNRSFMKSFIP